MEEVPDEEDDYIDDNLDEESEEDDDMAVDPICKMKVDPATAKWISSYNGKNYFFCAEGCKKKFDEDPEKWSSGDAPAEPHGCCGGH